ncbi:terminase gpA endonuclease subunit [Brevibacillus parabrevis]|nr:terminase gpA endonuclease subunit [Brevibacillus parabrevis]MDR4998980.1 hypothetical protein [Brevibacillus parabrevis]
MSITAEKTLATRREAYTYNVPAEVKVITAAVYTQDDRFEIEVVLVAGH